MLKEEQALREVTAEAVLLTAWVDKTLNPSLCLLNAKVIVRELEVKIYAQKASKGHTEQWKKSWDMVSQLMDLLEKLDSVANQNNTYHLIAKHALVQLQNVQAENERLKKELEAVNKALNAE